MIQLLRKKIVPSPAPPVKGMALFLYKKQEGWYQNGKKEKERAPIREHPRTGIRLYRRGREETLQKLYGPHKKAGPGNGRRLESQ